VHWRIKGVIQKVLSHVPYGARIHHQLQRRGGLRRFEKECDIKVEDWSFMLQHLASTGDSISGGALVEIGSGWYPTLPVCCWLGGARSVTTYDLSRHLQPDLLVWLAQHLRSHVPFIAEKSGVDEAVVRANHERFAKAIARGADLGTATEGAVVYRAPADFTRSGLSDASIDLVFSNSVLEHVPAAVLPEMFAEAKRILKPGAVMFHAVNCGDHYAYIDPQVSQLHYLQFSEAEWRIWNNDFQFQNRLRGKEFHRFAREAGFAIERDGSIVHPVRLAELDAITVHPMFAGYTREELSVTSVDMVARKP
jgi:SAM-dependent methyltransferase